LPGLEQRRFWEVDLSLRKRIAWLADVGNAIERHPPAPGAPFVIQAPPPTRDDDASCAGASGGARV
jgi:hypothetical protein